MKNCPLCTENIQDDAIFCHYCGRDIDSKISTEDHKKCPFCAENIKKEAIVCRYCQREIRTIDNGDNINKYEPKIREGTVELTLEDMDFLFESWGISYGKSSLEARKKISSVASNIHKGDMADVMGKFMKYKLANDKIV